VRPPRDTAKYSEPGRACSQAAPAERALIDACQIPGADALAYVNTQLNLGVPEDHRYRSVGAVERLAGRP
jgi:hypothetical protein